MLDRTFFQPRLSKALSSVAAISALGLTVAAGVPAKADSLTPVNVELSLLVDVSGSVSGAEYQLQMQGYRDAFTKLSPLFDSNEQVSEPTSRSQTESMNPMMMAGLFDILQDAVQTIESVDGAINLLDRVIQQDTASSQENQEVGDRFKRSPVEQAPLQVNNEDLYQRLARKSGEGNEAWYDRINPLIQHIPGADYRAWKATLSSEDREAYDAIVRQRNYEAAEIMNQVTPLIWKGVLQEEEESRQRQRESVCQQYGYCY